MIRTNYFLQLLVLITAVSFGSCIEMYTPVMDEGEDLLVVDGMISDLPGSWQVTLQHTRSFNSETGYLPETGASVSVTDDMGGVYPFTETSAGVYRIPDPSVLAQTGRTYTLSILTSNGREYVSEPEKTVVAGNIDALYIKPKTLESLEMNYYGDYYKVSAPGYEIYLDASGSSEQGSYYKFEGSLTLEYFSYYAQGLFSCASYYWKNYPLSDGLLISETHSLSYDSIKGLPVNQVYRSLTRYPVITDSHVGYQYSLLYGWIVCINQYTVTREHYQFLKRLQDQLEREDRIFDPAIDQVAGNMLCVSNQDEKVLGYFSVAAASRSAFYFYYQGEEHIEYRKLDFVPEIPAGGFMDNALPAFYEMPHGK